MEEKQSFNSIIYSQLNFNLENKIASLNKIEIIDESENESDLNLNQGPKFLDMRVKTPAVATYSIQKMSTENDWFNYSIGQAIGKKLKPLLKKITLDTTSYLTFVSNSPFTITTKNSTKNWDGTLYYSTDTEIWNEWDGVSTISSTKHNGEQKLYTRGIGNSIISGSYNKGWVLTGTDVSCSGNIENLLDFTAVANGVHPAMGSSCYSGLFYNCKCLISAPELPAIITTNFCYNEMFFECGITTAPALPATTLANYCYRYMFSGCRNLVTAPALPATTLAERCYEGMFSGCYSLVTAPALPATTLTNYCYSYMFSQCYSLVTSPALPATTLADYCYNGMFRYCESLKKPPMLPATEMTYSCYEEMFEGCKSLETPPTLPATTLATNCYYKMFRYCTSLTAIPKLPATTLTYYSYNSMFSGCTSIKLSTTENADYPTPYRIPFSGTGTIGIGSLDLMFYNTGGTFIGTPEINTTYYTNNKIVSDEPNEPVTTDFYLYGTPSESGNMAVADGDGYVLYDGAVLPKLPEWDKETYPYAYISHIPDREEDAFNNESYTLYVTVNRPYLQNNAVGVNNGGYGYSQHYTRNNPFVEWNEVKYNGGATITNKMYMLWTRADIMDSDSGELYMAGTDPIPLVSSEPIAEAIFTEGEFTVLPERDKINYSYLTLTETILTGEPRLIASTESGVRLSADTAMVRIPKPYIIWRLENGVWNNAQLIEGEGAAEQFGPMWANYDVQPSDETTEVFQGSEPILIYEKRSDK